MPALSANCSHLGYSHPVSKFLKLRKLLIEPVNFSEENGWVVRLSVHTHTQQPPHMHTQPLCNHVKQLQLDL